MAPQEEGEYPRQREQLGEKKHGIFMAGKLGTCMGPISLGTCIVVGNRLDGWAEAKPTPSSIGLGRIGGLS